MKKILFLVGSLRNESLNKRLALIAEKLLPEKCVATRYDLADIPLFNGDFESDPTRKRAWTSRGDKFRWCRFLDNAGAQLRTAGRGKERD